MIVFKVAVLLLFCLISFMAGLYLGHEQLDENVIDDEKELRDAILKSLSWRRYNLMQQANLMGELDSEWYKTELDHLNRLISSHLKHPL